MADSAIPPIAVDAHPGGMRRFETRGNWWIVHEVDGQLAFVIADLPPMFIDAPRPLEEMSDVELEQLLRTELEPRGRHVLFDGSAGPFSPRAAIEADIESLRRLIADEAVVNKEQLGAALEMREGWLRSREDDA